MQKIAVFTFLVGSGRTGFLDTDKSLNYEEYTINYYKGAGGNALPGYKLFCFLLVKLIS